MTTNAHGGGLRRCSARRGVCPAVSQRDYRNFYPFLVERQADLLEALVRFFYTSVQGRFPLLDCAWGRRAAGARPMRASHAMAAWHPPPPACVGCERPSVTVDVVLSKSFRRVYVVDFNPFGTTTEPLLFTWAELMEMSVLDADLPAEAPASWSASDLAEVSGRAASSPRSGGAESLCDARAVSRRAGGGTHRRSHSSPQRSTFASSSTSKAFSRSLRSSTACPRRWSSSPAALLASMPSSTKSSSSSSSSRQDRRRSVAAARHSVKNAPCTKRTARRRAPRARRDSRFWVYCKRCGSHPVWTIAAWRGRKTHRRWRRSSSRRPSRATTPSRCRARASRRARPTRGCAWARDGRWGARRRNMPRRRILVGEDRDVCRVQPVQPVQPGRAGCARARIGLGPGAPTAFFFLHYVGR